MNKTALFLLVALLGTCTTSLFAQQKTDQKASQSVAPAPPALDAIDMRNLFNMLSIDAYKFPIAGSTGKSFALNYIVEEYEGGKLKQTINWAQTLKSRLPEGTNLLRYLDVVGPRGTYLRVYAQQNEPQQITFRFGTDNILKTATFAVDSAKYPGGATYSTSNPPFAVGRKTPLVVRYMQSPGKALTPFPSDKTFEEAVKGYARVIAVYAEPIVITGTDASTPAKNGQTNKTKTSSK